MHLASQAHRTIIAAVTGIMIMAILAYGLHLRYQDPLSSPVIGAEDPFTHIVLTKEHLDRGYFDRSFHMGLQSIYPPGLHVLFAAFLTISGLDAYSLARLGPPILGGIAILTTYALGARVAGRIGGLTAALVVAVVPEHIFRTNLLFPTALDLAVLPAVLLSVAAGVEGSRAHALAIAITGMALAIAHPWVIALFVPISIAYAIARVGTAPERFSAAARQALPAVAVLGGLFGFAASTRWEASDSGFGHYLENFDAATLPSEVLWALPAVVAGLILFMVLARARHATTSRVARVTGAAAVAAVLWVMLPALTTELPDFVDYERQIGTPAIGLAIAGTVLAFLTLQPLAILGSALALGTFPFTAINFFQSWYLPHRTVVYLVLGVAVLAGAAVQIVANALPNLLTQRWPASRAARTGGAIAAVTVLVVTSSLVIAQAPEPYPWYRYFDAEELDALRAATEHVERDPDAAVISGDWRPNMVLKAFADDPDRVLYAQSFFTSPEGRRAFYGDHHSKGYAYHLIIDRHTRELAQQNGWNLGFLNDPGFQRQPCPVEACGSIEIYRIRGEAGT